MTLPLLAGIETGGTKTMMALGRGPGEIVAEARIATTTPDETIAGILAFFRKAQVAHGRAAALGLASFGPVGIHPGTPDWGRILATPKPGWAGADLARGIGRGLGLPIALDTDVNAAGLAEQRWGAAEGLTVALYLTVGTGIGGGLVVGGRPLHGLVHPEAGHIRPRRHPDDAGFDGVCTFHGDCLEGLASGPAILARSGASLSELGTGGRDGAIVADYLGQACAQFVLSYSPERIVIGGGVSKAPGLHAMIAARMRHWLGGYVRHPAIEADAFVCPPALGEQAGILGALALADDLLAA